MEEQMDMIVEPAVETAPAEAPAVPELPEQDLIDFVREHPGLDAATIPGHVWDAVRKGENLSRAYDRHELQQLRSSNLRLQKELGSMQRSHAIRRSNPGSMRSAGGTGTADSFLAGFNDE